jgi:flagellar biosynthesis protein FlgN
VQTTAPLNLEKVLEQQVFCAEAILEALRQEGDALRSGDPYVLNLVGANKSQLVEEMEALEIERQQLVEGGFEAPAALRRGPAGQYWNRLLGLIEQCRERNQRNGALVMARRTQIQQALELLRGSDATDLYDASGFSQRGAALNPLGAA